MATDLYRLIYASSVRGDAAAASLDHILMAARANNASKRITGLLLFHDGSFFQVLEGPRREVEAVFDAIRRDKRHGGVIVLDSASVSERAFPNWSMGYIGAHDMHPAQRESLIDLRRLVGGDQHARFTPSSRVSLHIEAFLNTFREFSPAF